MKLLRLALCLAVFVPVFAVLGVAAVSDSHGPGWLGLVAGGLLGVLFGSAFGGLKGRWLDVVLGPEVDEPGQLSPELERAARERFQPDSEPGKADAVKPAGDGVRPAGE